MGQQEKTKGKRDGQYRLESQREEDKNGWHMISSCGSHGQKYEQLKKKKLFFKCSGELTTFKVFKLEE